MRMIQHCFLRTVIVAGSTLIALPVTAISFEEMNTLCEEFMANHLNEEEWYHACVDAMEEWEKQQPPADQAAAETPPPAVFPIAQTAIVEGRTMEIANPSRIRFERDRVQTYSSSSKFQKCAMRFTPKPLKRAFDP